MEEQILLLWSLIRIYLIWQMSMFYILSLFKQMKLMTMKLLQEFKRVGRQGGCYPIGVAYYFSVFTGWDWYAIEYS